jgi:hypothetical protein
MEHEDFPTPGFEFMNEPATQGQKVRFVELANRLGRKLDINGKWPDPFSKWDAKRAIDCLLEELGES